MMRPMIALATVVAFSACSGPKDRGTPVSDKANTARELRIARPDTAAISDSIKLASRSSQAVSTVEQQPPRSVSAPRKKAVRHRSSAVAIARPKPSTPPADTAVSQGYAPSQPTEADTADVPAPARDTSSTQPPDTSRPTQPDTAAASGARPDTTPSLPSADTATVARVPDTVAAARPESTVTNLDTAAVAKADTSATRDSVAADPRDTTPLNAAVPAPDTTVASAEMGAAPMENAVDVSRRTLPIGTQIHAALDDSINSRRDSAGRSITAEVTENVTGAGGKILVPAGSTVHLTVTRLGSSKSKGSPGRLGFRVDGIQLGGGLQKVEATVKPVPRELRGRGVGGSEVAKVGVGAAGGAVLGRVITGNDKGAVIGGVVGAAGGAVVASQTATRDVVVKAKTPLVFVLTTPLVAP
jgi:hypothetical protein